MKIVTRIQLPLTVTGGNVQNLAVKNYEIVIYYNMVFWNDTMFNKNINEIDSSDIFAFQI